MADQQVNERLADYSGYNPEMTPEKALALFEEARAAGCPVARSEQMGGFHILLDYDDVKKVSSDDAFSTEAGMFRPVVDRPPLPPTEYDEPEHTKWRDLFRLGVDAKTSDKIEPGVREDVVALIEGFAASGSCDLVRDFAVPVPLLAICRILGLDPARGAELRALTDDLMANLENPAGAAAAYGALAQFGVAEVENRRAEPRDDFMTSLANAEMDGRPLNENEIAQTMASLLSAGHETSTVLMTNMLHEVLSRPEVRAALIADPKLIPAAVEEVLRLHPPVMGLYRRMKETRDVNGVELAEGDDVLLCWAANNRDPAVFDAPNEFRLDRKRNRHLTFGWGTHACLGAPVARMEMRVGLEELLKRLPDIELTEPGKDYKFTNLEWVVIESLDATFAPRSA
ncbi:MAG: Cytochrome [Solirubrobacterales bacterium]|nr:Cytochrome [Solirubrobacterales bacterium]